jgi:hypothetical protein
LVAGLGGHFVVLPSRQAALPAQLVASAEFDVSLTRSSYYWHLDLEIPLQCRFSVNRLDILSDKFSINASFHHQQAA